MWTKSFGNAKVKAADGYITDEHRNAIILSAKERWKKRRFKRTIKELSQFDNKKPQELESEFDNFDADYSYSASHFKGRNIVDLDFMYKQLLDGHKSCKITLSLTQYQRERLIGIASMLYLSLQNCSTVTMVKQVSMMLILSVQQIHIPSSCYDITCETGLCSVVLFLSELDI